MKLFFAVLFFAASCLAWGFEAVVNGKTNASVYIAEPSLPSEKKAAEELISYFEKMSGAKLSLIDKLPADGNRIVIGNNGEVQQLLKDIDLSTLKPDEIVICTPNPNTLVLSGSKPRGTLYAVYSLLEMLGVRFWSPEYEFIPQKMTVAIPNIIHRYAPPFSFRQGFSQLSYHDKAWCAKLKLNGDLWSVKMPEEYGGAPQMELDHTLTLTYLKPEVFFKSHPEWYAWREKENARVPKQICMTNQEALNELVKEVRLTLRQEPEREFISVAFHDNDEVCQCKNCTEMFKKEGSYSALSIYGANYVARAIKDEFPRVKVMIQAYWTTTLPPKSMKMEPNTAVVLGILDRNHGFPDTGRSRIYKKWAQLSHGNFYIWDYFAAFHNYLLPTPNLYVIETNFRFYRDQRAKGIYVQLPWGSISDFQELRTYLAGKLSWNPNLSGKKLIAEYLRGVCGKASPYVQQYIDLLENAKIKKGKPWIGVAGGTASWLSAADVLKARELFEHALKVTASNPEVQRRVRRISATVIMLSINRYQDISKEALKQKKQLPSYTELVDELEVLGKEFKCDTYREWDSFDNLIKKLRTEIPKGNS